MLNMSLVRHSVTGGNRGSQPGATENAEMENARASKMKGWKSREWKQLREWKLLHQKAGVENAGETSMESQNSRSLTLRRVEHWISLPKWVTTAM